MPSLILHELGVAESGICGRVGIRSGANTLFPRTLDEAIEVIVGYMLAPLASDELEMSALEAMELIPPLDGGLFARWRGRRVWHRQKRNARLGLARQLDQTFKQRLAFNSTDRAIVAEHVEVLLVGCWCALRAQGREPIGILGNALQAIRAGHLPVRHKPGGNEAEIEIV